MSLRLTKRCRKILCIEPQNKAYQVCFVRPTDPFERIYITLTFRLWIKLTTFTTVKTLHSEKTQTYIPGFLRTEGVYKGHGVLIFCLVNAIVLNCWQANYSTCYVSIKIKKIIKKYFNQVRGSVRTGLVDGFQKKRL